MNVATDRWLHIDATEDPWGHLVSTGLDKQILREHRAISEMSVDGGVYDPPAQGLMIQLAGLRSAMNIQEANRKNAKLTWGTGLYVLCMDFS